MATPSSPDAPPSKAARMRGYLLRMVLLVVALDAVAIALYHLLDIPAAGPRVRGAFVVAWTVVTLVLVSSYLRRIRLVRRGYEVK